MRLDARRPDDEAFEHGTGPCLAIEVQGELGRGGMSVVYLARQVALNRLVALKVIRARVYADAMIAARFRDEAQAAARFQHPNIIQVYEVGEFEGQGYLVLEYAGRRQPGTKARRDAATRPRDRPKSSKTWRVHSTTPTSTESCIATSSRRTSS